MALVTQADIEEYSGFKYSDFTESGLPMTAPQWASFISTLIPQVTQMIHRYCKVFSFEPASYIEYHSGKGANNFDSAVSDYDYEDTIYFLRQLYVNDGSLIVQEDMGTKQTIPLWALRQLRPNTALAEIDTLAITSSPTSSGNLTITLNNLTSYNVAVTVGMTTAQVVAAIVALGAVTDSSGVTWTPTNNSPYVTITANKTGPANIVQFNPGVTGISYLTVIYQAGCNVAGGDYEVQCENDVTRVLFYNNIPNRGSRNITFTYNTGYAYGSVQLNDIMFQAKRACVNVLLQKKKIQEANTIRNWGVKDYSQMFDAFSEAIVIDDRIKQGLDQYRRAVIPGQYAYQ